MTEPAKNDGEAPIIVSLVEAAMDMFTASIKALPDPDAPEFSDRALVILSGLRKLEAAVSEAARRPRATPSVIIALSRVRCCYDDLMATAASAPGSTLGQRLYTARRRARLSAREIANGAGLRADLVQAIEAEEQATQEETATIERLIAVLEG
jgi:hypothetical protein